MSVKFDSVLGKLRMDDTTDTSGSSTTTLSPMTELEVTAMVQEITAETEE